MTSLRQSLAGIGVSSPEDIAIRGSFGRRTSPSLRDAVMGMSDPRLNEWRRVGTALSKENESLSSEAQGVATDGSSWYVCSNTTKTVVRLDDGGRRVREYEPPSHVRERLKHQQVAPFQPKMMTTHFGAPGYHDGWIYVPTQGSHGVWRFTVDGARHEWHKASMQDEPNLFAWCAVEPVTEILYTCNYDKPKSLRAYRRATLDRRPADDIELGSTPLQLDKVQGAVFTACGRLLMVRWDFNALFVFSSLNGFCFGAIALGEFGSTSSEVESVAVRAWHIGGQFTPIHIMELDNDNDIPLVGGEAMTSTCTATGCPTRTFFRGLYLNIWLLTMRQLANLWFPVRAKSLTFSNLSCPMTTIVGSYLNPSHVNDSELA